MNWLLLVSSIVGLALTLNARRPIYAPASAAVVSFFAGWLTAELALHHMAWQALLAVAIVYTGAIASWQGALAFVLALASCALLARLHRDTRHAEHAVETALRDGIGADYHGSIAPPVKHWLGSAFEWSKILLPFPVRHSDVISIHDVPFFDAALPKGRHVRLKLDIHRHRKHATLGGKAPTLVYVHGGGWVIGQRRYQGLPLMKHLAARGWVCISIDYRLSPRATFPDHLVDVKRALAWVREHAAEYGADPDFVVLCGNSAGAHLAALAALTQNDPAYQPGFEAADTSVSACIALYGIFDFTNRNGQWKNGGMAQLLERHVMKAPMATSLPAYASASPLHRVHEAAPPFLVVHGDSDSLAPTDESRHFCEALRKITRAPVVYAEIPGAQHAFEIFPSPRTAHFLTGATSFVAHVYSRYLEERGAEATAPRRAVQSDAAELAGAVESGEAIASL